MGVALFPFPPLPPAPWRRGPLPQGGESGPGAGQTGSAPVNFLPNK